MLDNYYTVSKNVLIMQRDGQCFAGQLSPEIPPVILQSLDLILIDKFSRPLEVDNAINEFVEDETVKELLPDTSVEKIKPRVIQFIESGLLTSATLNSGSRAENFISFLNLDSKNILKTMDLNSELLLSSNFAMQPVDGGYKIWSSVYRKYRILEPKLAIFLLAFSIQNKANKVIEENTVWASTSRLCAAIDWFVKEGLLLVKRADKTSSDPLPASLPQPIFNNPEYQIEGWRELQPDNRIPVYFVPHMENHYPLALGVLYSAIANYNDGELSTRYQLIPITYLSPEDFLKGPYTKFGRGVWLFSNYMWSLEVNRHISHAVKKHHQGNITIHGGPSTPNYKAKSEEFFRKNLSVDITVHGEGELAICEVLYSLAKSDQGDIVIVETEMKSVSGITFKRQNGQEFELNRTADRVRMKEPDSVPSPYLKNYFADYKGKVEAAIIESNRGCPFGCTFCDWGSATSQKVRKYDLERVKLEIDWIAKNSVKVLWIADANFGMYERDIELASHIVKTKESLGFPSEVVVNYTKNTTGRLTEIIKIFNEGGIISQGVISIQSTDVTTLKVINRKNIKTEKYDELSEIFNQQNLPLSTDLMIGLPGMTCESFKRDLQRYFDRDVSVKAYPTQLLPNSPMADPQYIEEYKIKTDSEDFLISTYSYSEKDLFSMKELYKFFTIADGYSVLRYVLRYLQWEYNILATDFLTDLQAVLNKSPRSYPKINFVFRFFETDKCMPGGWNLFYSELARYIHELYDIDLNDQLIEVLKVNELAMPDQALEYPISAKFKFNIKDYFSSNLGKEKKISNLKSENHAITFDDPDGLTRINADYLQYDSHQFFWEVESPISRAKSSFNL